MRDVIVVGAGGGGPVLATELAARGLDVLMLEAGPHYDDPENQWSRYENDANNPLTGYFRYGPASRFDKPAWFRELPQNSMMQQLAGVGGTTQHYFGNCPRATPGVFTGYNGADADNYDTTHQFPFSYRELVPYYEWVEHTLPVQTAAMGTKETVFIDGAEGMGLAVNPHKDIVGNSFRPQENAILQPGGTAGRTDNPDQLRHPQASGCTFCGYCYQGCFEPRRAPRNLKAKRSTDNSYIPMALTANRWSTHGKAVTLLPNAYATRIHADNRGGQLTAHAVTWRDTQTGEGHSEQAHIVVMAGGCTEDPRLWLNSGLPNPNGWVGRGYTDHYFDWLIGTFDSYTGSSKGPSSAARVDFPGYGGLEQVGLPPALQAFSAGLSSSGIRGYYDNGRGYTGAWDGKTGRIIGNELKQALANVDQLINVLVLTDDDVQPDNRVTLSAFPEDENGPIPKVSFPPGHRSRRTIRNREKMSQVAARLLRAAGARTVFRLDWAPLLLHVQSTMRMGQSARDSVLDPTAEARWVKRLFIADNAALANSCGGSNPTLTTQALATRTAEQILVRYFDGDPFVDREQPTPSTDDRVTEAVLRHAQKQ